MQLMISGPAVTINPIGDLGANADDCLRRLIFGTNIRYIGLDLLSSLKSIAIKAVAETPDLTIRELVDCWRNSPGAEINGVRDVADVVAHVYLPS